jgi:hypothetical protein
MGMILLQGSDDLDRERLQAVAAALFPGAAHW